jgi:hypothetical protein
VGGTGGFYHEPGVGGHAHHVGITNGAVVRIATQVLILAVFKAMCNMLICMFFDFAK